MRRMALALLLLSLSPLCTAQAAARDITSDQLQSILELPLDQAVNARELYKHPLNFAYERQMALIEKDCLAELAKGGQQGYNICMGHSSVQTDSDFATFYENLQMLCHNQSQLKTMQASQAAWNAYRDSTLDATRAAWPDGSGASGFFGGIYLLLVRNRMRELYSIYSLNIAQ